MLALVLRASRCGAGGNQTTPAWGPLAWHIDDNSHLLKTDQRGEPRPDKEDTGGCDMGAYERQTD
jgi:hypothetical protein